MRISRSLFTAFTLLVVGANGGAQATLKPLSLWYATPAAQWVEAPPIGNGRLGAMVFGGPVHERIQFNESSVWTGEPHDYARSGAARYLPSIRALLNENRQGEAEAESHRRAGTASGAAIHVAERQRDRAARARRIRGRSRVGARIADACARDVASRGALRVRYGARLRRYETTPGERLDVRF